MAMTACREVLYQRDLFVGERTHLPAVDRNRANQLTLREHGDYENRSGAAYSRDLDDIGIALEVARLGRDIDDMGRLPAVGGAPSTISARR